MGKGRISQLQLERRAGLSLTELVLALGAFAAAALWLTATQVEALAAGEPGTRQRQAVEIARDQLELVAVLPFDTLAPTDGFVAPFWVRVPGYFDGELPVAGHDGQERVYRIEWSVAEADEGLRAVDLRVSWAAADGAVKTHAVSGMRGRS